jgi:hypothetical protein
MKNKIVILDTCVILDALAAFGEGEQSKFDQERAKKLKIKSQGLVNPAKIRGGIIGLIRQGKTVTTTKTCLKETHQVMDNETLAGNTSIENQKNKSILCNNLNAQVINNQKTDEFIDLHDAVIEEIKTAPITPAKKALITKHKNQKNNPLDFPKLNKENTNGAKHAQIWADLELLLVANEHNASVYTADGDLRHLDEILQLSSNEKLNNYKVTILETQFYCGAPSAIHELLKTTHPINQKCR